MHLQDNRLGDDTGLDGVIVDQGGPGKVGESGVIAVPTMNEWCMIAFMMFAGLASVYRMRRKT